MQNQLKNSFATLLLVALLLGACVPGTPPGPDLDEVATLVSATLTAEAAVAEALAEEEAPEEAEGEPVAEDTTYGSCENTDLFTVAYVREGNAWLWIEGGENFALTASGDVGEVRISDDGCRIAYTRNLPIAEFESEDEALVDPSYNELWVVYSDGSNNQLLVGPEFFSTFALPEGAAGISVHQFAWQPGAHTLAFNTQLVSYGLALHNNIHLVDGNSAEISTLLGAGEGGNFYFSLDGQQLAFSTPNSISVINVDGSNLRTDLLNYEPVITYSEFMYYARPYWAQDGSALMVAVPPADGFAPTEDGFPPDTSLWRIPLDGGDAVQTAAIGAVWFVQGEARISADLSKVAYLHPVGAPEDNTHVLVIAGSEGGPDIASIPGAAFGDWSPDSEQFIYWTSAGGVQVFLGSAADGSSSPLPDLTDFPAAVASIDWTNGPFYLQALFGNQTTELSWVNIDGIGIVLDTYAGFPQFDSAP